ncbi:PREDICTED: UDP-glycosyltransferase 73C1-like [Ipomoea nil]|uniref:UDP-glycosyltransferase 73C1-like n=1 Tax=Ipomoea nil TaxID=35883 RepID=UPI000901AB58|nr:PREDICTED: UDP-glycosyltransferase 73C1-like [Ipomoea nil]
MAATTVEEQFHFVVLPFMSPGHTIPMIDFAKSLASFGVRITILLTPQDASRVKSVIVRAQESGLPIHILQISFPCTEVGLPEGCDNVDFLPSFDLLLQFYEAVRMLQPQVEGLLREMKPSPSCIIADMNFPWTNNVAQKLKIPRIVFHVMGSFPLLCLHNIRNWSGFQSLESESQYFEVPGLPHSIQVTKAQVSQMLAPISDGKKDITKEIQDAEGNAFGIVMNSFEELEREYTKEFKKAKGKKVWSIGPVSLCNKEDSDMVERGNKATIDKHQCLKWLDSKETTSVLYVCLGSLARLPTSQMIELGLALESSKRPFIWAIKHISNEFQNWLQQEKYEERVKGQGLIIFGWAPQVLILSHPSIGGFLSHCGWNSALEAITAGVPLINWPMFGEQFLNERLVVDVLKTGVRVGVELPVLVGREEQTGVQVNRDDIALAIEQVMSGGEEAEMRRERMKKLGEMARTAMEEGGSSFLNIAKLIQDVAEETNTLKSG